MLRLGLNLGLGAAQRKRNRWAYRDAVADYDFANDRYFMQGSYYSNFDAVKAAKSGSYSGGGVGRTEFDKAGVLQTYPANKLRLGYDPLTGVANGALFEPEARTNLVRNNTFAGAVGGSPGVFTGASSAASVPTGCIRTLSFETIKGVECVRIKIAGTVSADGAIQITQEQASFLPVTQGQIFTFSTFHQLIKSTGLPNWVMELWELTSAGGFISTGSPSKVLGVTPNVAMERPALTRTIAAANAGQMRPIIRCDNIVAGTVVDFEVVIGLGQVEQAPNASTPTKTGGTAVTSDVDSPIIFPFAQSGEHTLFVEARPYGNDVSRGVMGINTGASNRSQLRSNANLAAIAVFESSVTQFASADSVAWNSFKKLCGVVGANDGRFYVDGNTIGNDTSIILPSTTTITLGGSAGAPASFQGHIRRATLFPRKLTAAEAIALTSQPGSYV